MPHCFNVGVAENIKINRIKRTIFHFIIKTGVNHAIKEITVNVIKNKIRAEKQFKVPVDILYYGIDPIHIQKNVQESIARFQRKRINLLSSGVFFPYRNYETQVKVVELLRQNGIDARFKIFGSTDFDIQYTDKISDLSVILTNYNLRICR